MTLYRWFAWPLNCSYTFCMHTKPISAIVLGAGMRGADAYAPYALAHPDQLDIVGVAEPDAVRRHRFAAAHDIAPANSFTTWQAVFERPKFADVVINTTPRAICCQGCLVVIRLERMVGARKSTISKR